MTNAPSRVGEDRVVLPAEAAPGRARPPGSRDAARRRRWPIAAGAHDLADADRRQVRRRARRSTCGSSDRAEMYSTRTSASPSPISGTGWSSSSKVSGPIRPVGRSTQQEATVSFGHQRTVRQEMSATPYRSANGVIKPRQIGGDVVVGLRRHRDVTHREPDDRAGQHPGVALRWCRPSCPMNASVSRAEQCVMIGPLSVVMICKQIGLWPHPESSEITSGSAADSVKNARNPSRNAV